MNNIEYSGLEEILSRIPAFIHLCPDDLCWLATNIQLFNCSTGQVLLLPDRLPSLCYCLIEGRARVLHQDSRLGRPTTLAYSVPGDLVGWAGLVRYAPCEWVSAISPLKLLGFTSEIFYELQHRSPEFRRWLDASNSPAELISILTPALASLPSAKLDDRECLRKLLPGLSLHPYRDQRSLPPDDTAVWLWNIKPPTLSVNPGQQVDPNTLSSVPSGQYLRLLRIERVFWDQLFTIANIDSSDTSQLPTVFTETNRYSSIPLLDNILPVSTNHETSPTNNNVLLWKGRRLPVCSGVGPTEQVLACLEMLSIYYNTSFRRDVLLRAAHESIKGNVATLQTLGNLATFMGYTGSISSVEQTLLHRISFPCCAILLDQPSIVYSIDDTTVKAVVPEYGAVTLPISELVGDLDGARILALQPGRDSQQRKLNISWFLPQLRKYRRSLLEVLISSLVLQLLNLAQPLVMQQIFDKVIAQQNLDTLYTLGIVLLGVSLFQGLISAVRTYLFADTTNRIDISLGTQVIHHLMKLPLRYFDKRPVGELQTRIAELGNIRNFLTGNLLSLFLDSIFSIIYIAVMLYYSFTLTVVTLGTVPLFLGLTFIASPLIRGQLRTAAEKNAQTQSYLVEALNGIPTIKAQSAENTVVWHWRSKYSSFMSESFRSLLIGVSSGTVGSFLNQLTGLLTLWVGAYLVIQGSLTIGQLIAFRIISGYVVGPLLNLATSWQSFQGVALSMERLADVIDASPEGSLDEFEQLPLPRIQGAVSFEDVDFSFTDAGPLVVNNVSFDIPPASFVGIVGRSGSGKSTIMKLLPRLYEPSSGRILIDGYDITKVQLSSVRRQIGIVPQESLLFDGTVRENISLVTPESTFEDVVTAARVACAHDFIMQLPEGYATRVGERGSNLSGGQRQRIAIARAVLQSPSLLILDEATSALDYLTERQVCLNLKEFFAGSTVFFITHRLTTIRSADLIILMDSGYIAEMGSHADLLELQSRYYALYSQQESNLD